MGDVAVRRPRLVAAIALALMVLCGGFGAGAAAQMNSGGFVTGELDSVRAGRYLDDHFPGSQPNFVLRLTADDGADSPAARDAAARVVAILTSTPGVFNVQSYWTSRADLRAALRGRDGDQGLVIAALSGAEPGLAAALADRLSIDEGPVRVTAGGAGATFADMNSQISHDLVVAEAVAIPVTAILLTVVFGSVVAAALPIVIGVFAVAATLGILRVLTAFAEVSIFALNMTTALGLALAIDYSLFIVSRYREELAAGASPPVAVRRSLRTAGHTVLYSALVVALSLAALLIFPQYFFRSFAYAGIAVVVAATAAALVVLPALLMLVGDRIDAGDGCGGPAPMPHGRGGIRPRRSGSGWPPG
ncbi:MMPL family transporter [Nocardia thailandica]|uniref:MMPL family transporter n=1 Tax=Nocardia thailandica TaxID=257275 RepID=A0ABW6PQI5_9NOCA